MAANNAKLSLNCVICSNHYSNPLMMPCLHSFCRKCIEQQLEEQGSSAGSIKCPTCDTVSYLPSGGVSSLPSNLWLARQVELSSYQHKLQEGKNIACDRCVKRESGSAVAFCCNCRSFLCSSCRDDHKWWKETISHDLVDISEKNFNVNSVNIPREPVKCSKHTSKKMKFFCEDCQCLVCRDCIVTKHKEHKQVDLDDVSEREKEALSKITKEVENVLGDLETAIASGEKMKQQVVQRKKEVDEEITNKFKVIYNALHEREKLLHDQNEKIFATKISVLDNQLKTFGVLKEKVVFGTQEASRTVDYTAIELLSTKTVIQQQLRGTLNAVQQLDMEPAELDNICLFSDTAPVVEQISKLGRVTGLVDPAQCTVEEGLAIPLAAVGIEKKIKVALRDSEGQVVGGKIPVSCTIVNKASKSVLQLKGTGDNGHASLSFVPEAVGEYELSIKVKNWAISLGSWSRTIWVRSGRYFSNDYCLGYRNWVVVDSNGYVYAIKENRIERFGTNGSKIRTIGAEHDQLQQPCGLTLVDNVLYVVDRGTNCVHKFACTGEYLGQFGSQGSGARQYWQPLGICNDGKGHILVANCTYNRIQVYSTYDGSLSHSFSCSSPYDVAVDNIGNIHVASNAYNESRIRVFSSDGQEAGSYNVGGSITNLCNISIDENGYRFVRDYNNQVILNQQGEVVSQ